MREYSILLIRNEQDAGGTIETAIGGGIDGQIEWCRVETLFDGLRTLRERSFDLIVSDLTLADGEGLAAVKHLCEQSPRTPTVVLCNAGERETAIKALGKGAVDFYCYEDADVANLSRSTATALRIGAADNAKTGADRRVNARFPCRLAISFQALEHPFLAGEAVSETVNISSKGLLFTTSEPLQKGQLLQLSVDWPARLENSIPLKLVAEGRIVRFKDGQAAVRIDRYEFRTRRVKAGATAEKAALPTHVLAPAARKTGGAGVRKTA